MTRRAYDEACAAAHALDLVGERWALLVVRELLLGPKRFTDLRAGLPSPSPNVLSQRLRELMQVGVVRRRKLGPPASTWVYELTEWGLELEPVLIQLGRWGRRSPYQKLDAKSSVDALMLRLRSDFAPKASRGWSASYALHFGEERFAVRVADGRIEVARGEAVAPDAVIETSPWTFMALLSRRQRLDEAVHSEKLKLTGEADTVARLLDALPPPEPAPLPSA